MNAQLSLGAQASFIPTPYGPIPFPFIRGGVGLYANIGSVVLLEGQTDSQQGSRITATPKTHKITQGFGAAGVGISIEYTRNTQPGQTENILTGAILGGLLGVEWNITAGTLLIGPMPGVRGALVVGVKAEGKQGIKIQKN
jgi:hypothetical protein